MSYETNFRACKNSGGKNWQYAKGILSATQFPLKMCWTLLFLLLKTK